MKKLLVFLTAVAFAFALAVPAMAADDDACKNCVDKGYTCDLSNIKVGSVEQEENTAGSESCNYFDYDGVNARGAIGYCDSEANENCKIIFDICDCTDTSKFKTGQTIGIRMTMLTEGVYFAHSGDAIAMNKFKDDEYDDGTLCESGFATSGDRFAEFLGGFNYYDADGDEVDAAAQINGECTVDNDEKAVVMESETDMGYVILASDVADGVCCWWLDMPAMRYDLAEITKGDMVEVKIELLHRDQDICDNWEPICDCVVELGILGCDEFEVDLALDSCMYFPYVLTGGSWATGVVVSNTSGILFDHYGQLASLLADTPAEGMFPDAVAPAEQVITYTLEDSTGALFTKTFAAGTLTSPIHSFVLTVDGWAEGTPAAGPAMLRVNTNFPADGYSFLTDGNFGAGTLSRLCMRGILNEGLIKTAAGAYFGMPIE